MPKIKLAVYGTLRDGEYNHDRMKGAEYIGTYRIPGFQMRTNGWFPYAIPVSGKKLVVELYSLTPEILGRIDDIEGYPLHYDRKLIDVANHCAWIYIPRHIALITSGTKPIESGDWCSQ